MTEAEWIACTDPTPMLEFVCRKASNRKIRLIAVACCRRIWDKLKSRRGCQESIETAERFADGLATIEDLTDAHDQCGENALYSAELYAVAATCLPNLRASVKDVSVCVAQALAKEAETLQPPDGVTEHGDHRQRAERASQANLLRDIFGPLLFRPVTIDQAWLTPTVKEVAGTIYQERAFDLLPILADALEDAGCTSADILGHCRQPGEHVRGCWVLDLILVNE